MKSNDPEEGKFVINHLEDALNHMLFDDSLDESIVLKFRRAFTEFRQDEECFGRTKRVIMALSLCELENSLPLWRIYGNRGKGVAIGISKDKLEKWGMDPDYSFKQIEYIDDKQMGEMAEDFWRENFEADESDIVVKLRELYMSGFFMKRKENEYEKEWRLIYTGITLDQYLIPGLMPEVPDDIDAHITEDDIVLFNKLPISEDYAINTILNGPKCKIKDTEMKLFLKKNKIEVYGVGRDNVHMNY